MPIKRSNTKYALQNGVKVLTYGDAGMGKTVLCSTAPRPLIISAEAGLMSLADKDIETFEISTREDCNEIYGWVTTSAEAKNFDTICIDSLSEIAEVLLSAEMKLTKDPRQAYGVMANEMAILVRAFRDLLEKNVYFSAKVKRVVDEGSGRVTFIPSVPGQALLQNLPYFFDEVFALRLGKLADGTTYRYLQTGPDAKWAAKDRSGKLDHIEKPDLTSIFSKIGQVYEHSEIIEAEIEEVSSAALDYILEDGEESFTCPACETGKVASEDGLLWECSMCDFSAAKQQPTKEN